jgi:hypothetical protein
MDIAAESNVLDVKHPIPDLSILFEGRDIEEERSNLKILTIRVINDGESNIHENDFDSRIPFGLQIDDGVVVRAQIVGANSTYLTDNLRPQVQAPNRILFEKVIFDRGKFVSLEILILHKKAARPRITPLGKIAGLDQISVTDSFSDHQQETFLQQVFRGAVAIQIARTIAYALIALGTVIAVGFSIAGISSTYSNWKKHQRRRKLASLPLMRMSEHVKIREALNEIFVENGIKGLIQMREYLEQPEQLKEDILERYRLVTGRMDTELLGPRSEPEKDTKIMKDLALKSALNIGSIPLLEPLVSAKLISSVDNRLSIDPALLHALQQHIRLVSRRR